MPALDGHSAEQLFENFLQAQDQNSAEIALGRLLEEHLHGRVRNFFVGHISTSDDHSNYRFTRFDAEDLTSVAVIEITRSLRRRREIPSVESIINLSSFTNSICKAVFSDFWRDRFKEHTQLKNRVRYLLRSRHETFGTERTAEGSIVCFLHASPDRLALNSIDEIVDRVREVRVNFPIIDESSLLEDVLGVAGGRIRLSDAVEVIAILRGIKDIPPSEIVVADADLESRTSEYNEYQRHVNLYELDFLWREIKELPRFQRVALVYNLRDEGGQELNTVWFESGIATLAELAAQFELDEESMADLLPELPYTDKKIAEVLRIEEGQSNGRVSPEAKVANLRKVARENLRRRRDGKERRRR
jgi:hypothetical protein